MRMLIITSCIQQFQGPLCQRVLERYALEFYACELSGALRSIPRIFYGGEANETLVRVEECRCTCERFCALYYAGSCVAPSSERSLYSQKQQRCPRLGVAHIRRRDDTRHLLFYAVGGVRTHGAVRCSRLVRVCC